MPWKFEDNRWLYQLDFERFATNINGKLKQVSIKNVFNSIKGSWITDLDFWSDKWSDYFNYNIRKFNKNDVFINYFDSDNYEKYIQCYNRFMSDLKFNNNLIDSEKKYGKYQIAKQCYESIKYIVDHLHLYRSSWLPLDPSYKKPIKKSENLGKNIPLRIITLPPKSYVPISHYLIAENSKPRRGRPRKPRVYHPDLYGFP